MTNISGAVVLVTGANGGLGVEFVAQALERGATKVYAAARTPRSWDDERIVPLRLDVTDAAAVAEAAKHAGDTTVVINNAGVGGPEPISSAEFDDIRSVMETNFFGALAVARDFAPVLARNGGGALVNVLSVASWIAGMGAYSASKAALWSATNSLRLELAPQKTQVVGLHLGYTDTPMTAGLTVPKEDPAVIVRNAYEGIEAGQLEILADGPSQQVKARLSASVEANYPQLGNPLNDLQ